jgi:hypothetical protein
MKIVLSLLLLGTITFLTFMCWGSIWGPNGPIVFDNAQQSREDAIKTRLMDIRKAQIEYKNKYGEHAGSFEELARFLNEEKLPFVIKEGALTDEQLEKGMTEQKAIKEGLIRRDTIWVLAKDTLFGRGFDPSVLAYVPVEGVDARFTLDTATIKSGSGYTVKVFESAVLYDTYLYNLNSQLLINLKDRANKLQRYPGLRVGSVTEINNNAGNWE